MILLFHQGVKTGRGGGGSGEGTPSWRDSHEYNGSMPRVVFFFVGHGSSREGASPHSDQ